MTHALIIDDDRRNLAVLGQVLELANIEYTAVADSTKVESILAERTAFDIIILDLEMPQLDGYDLFKIIQKQAHLDNVPVVACSVHTNETPTVRDIGFYSFIAKPINVDVFPEQIRKILANQPVWNTA